MKREKLIAKILDTQLKNEIENILAIIKQGFDISVHIEFPEIISALKKLLEDETQSNPRVFRLITDPANIAVQNSDDLDFAFIPTILIGQHKLKHGTGFVRYALESPDKLMGQAGRAIEEILNTFGLENYLDCFDGKIFAKLKEIAKIRGTQCLIDAVVQTAYLSGFRGSAQDAHHYLDTFNTSVNFDQNDRDVSIETCGKRFLSHCITYGENAFAFLKSSLSFYVVSNQGHTMTRASQILNISRTTLMEHLKTAERLKISHFFENGAGFINTPP